MAVTGAIFNSLSFGGVNSADYGIYITGEGVFNAPKRAVNMVAVPGRNGSIAIDQGHWENIEVTYPAGTFGMDEQEFRTALSNFRNAIASQVGYQRLTDTYHPDEYRIAIYTDGLEVEPTTYNKAGEFELKFNCKPQRWLTSGEVPVTIGEWGATKEASGEIVTIESEGGEAAKSLEVSLEPIQAGSGEPSPTNVRPISGRTEVVTQRTGKNLLTYTEMHRTISGVSIDISADGVLHAYGTARERLWVAVGEFEAKGGKTYFYGNLPRGMGTTTYFVTRYGSTGNTYEDSEYTFADDTNAVSRFYVRQGVTLDVTFKLVVAEAENSTTYTTSLGRTVYGGTLDVVSGVLTVDRAFRTFNGSENWEKINQGLRLAGGFGGKAYSTKDVSNMLTYATSDPTTNPNSYKFTVGGFVNVGVPYTVAEWKSLLATNNLQIAYELATPQTYQLTPQQISLLLGENHLWSDGEISVEYGDDPNSLWNPTRYDAGPLLAVKGHGDVSFNGYTVAIDAGEYGVINVKGKQTSTNPITYATDVSLYNDGDTIYVFVECDWVLTTLRNIYARSYSNQHDTGVGQTVMEPRSTSGNNRAVGTTIINSWFLSSQDETLTNTFSFDSLLSNGTTVTVSVIVEVTWDATNKTLSVSSSVPHASGWGGSHRTFPTITIEAASTKTYLGDPTLVDCELGEAYKVEDGEIISLNKYIELGSDLPKLSPGANDVTTDNTITELKVTPNWWKL